MIEENEISDIKIHQIFQATITKYTGGKFGLFSFDLVDSCM